MLWTGGLEAVIIGPPQVQRISLCAHTLERKCTVLVTSEYGSAVGHTL